MSHTHTHFELETKNHSVTIVEHLRHTSVHIKMPNGAFFIVNIPDNTKDTVIVHTPYKTSLKTDQFTSNSIEIKAAI